MRACQRYEIKFMSKVIVISQRCDVTQVSFAIIAMVFRRFERIRCIDAYT